MFFGLVKDVLPPQEHTYSTKLLLGCCLHHTHTHTNDAANKLFRMHAAMNLNMQIDTVNRKQHMPNYTRAHTQKYYSLQGAKNLSVECIYLEEGMKYTLRTNELIPSAA